MDSGAKELIQLRCRASREQNSRLVALMATSVASGRRATFARCAIDLALEHHSGLTRVVDAGEYGTGGALLRPLLEAATAAYWFVYVATRSEIEALPTDAVETSPADIPGLGDMLKTLTPFFPDVQALSNGLRSGGTGKWLHKYTHGGTPQLNRRGSEGWQEGEVLLTLIRGDLFSTLAACLETVIQPSAALADFGFNRRDELAAEMEMTFDIPPIPRQPHALPDAPLLREDCGTPEV